MFEFGSSNTLSSLRRASRSSSPVKKRRETRPASEPDLNEFEKDITAPPLALTFSPAHQVRPIEEFDDSSQQTSHLPQLPSRESFLGKTKLPSLANTQSKRESRNFSFPFHPAEPADESDDSPMPTTHRPPTESTDKSDFTPTLMGDTTGEIHIEAKRGLLANWFQGTSDPVTLGVLPLPIKEDAEPRYSPEMERAKLQKKNTFQQSQSASTSRFSFFGPKPAPEKKPDIPGLEHDEFLNLDINAALFPGRPADPFSPAAFKNLLMNSEGLLLRLQTAYKLRTMALHELTAEKASQEEELEETETRVKHLKMQLDDMAEKALEQENQMNALCDELARERQKRREEDEARKRSVLLVKAPADRSPPIRHEKRGSGATFQSDSGFESEDESCASSIFSRGFGAVSPAPTTGTSSSIVASPHITQRSEFYDMKAPAPPTPPTRTSTFQKVLKGLSSPEKEGHDRVGTPAMETCSNCQGMKATEAWGVIGVLREENKMLKVRVGKLESEVDACLDLMQGAR